MWWKKYIQEILLYKLFINLICLLSPKPIYQAKIKPRNKDLKIAQNLNIKNCMYVRFFFLHVSFILQNILLL